MEEIKNNATINETEDATERTVEPTAKKGFQPFIFIKSLFVTGAFCLIIRYVWNNFIYPWWAFKVGPDVKSAIFWIIVVLISIAVYVDNKKEE